MTTTRALTGEEILRIEQALRCKDCDDLPKVPRAGECEVVDERNVQVLHNGLRVLRDGYYGAWMTELIRRLRGHHEPQEERLFHELLGLLPGDATIVELGAYWAYYSLWFCIGAAGRRAIVIEPDPGNLEVGRINFEINGLKAEFLQHAAGARSGRIARFHCSSDGKDRPVDVLSVDDLVESRKLERIDLLHVDVQGAELSVLEGGERAIRSGRIRFVFLATHHFTISGDTLTHRQCIERIQALGGTVLAEFSVDEAYSGDGLVVASFDQRDRDRPAFSCSRNRDAHGIFPPSDVSLGRALDRVRALEAELGRVHMTWSWRATRPFRWALRILTGRTGP